MTIELTPEDIAAVDELWTQQPRRPKMPGLAPLPTGAVTVTITCRVCGLRAPVEVTAPAKLCRECSADLDATERYVKERLEATMQAGDALDDGWAARQNALPDELRERWQKAIDAREQAEIRVRRLGNARLYIPTEATTIAQLREARAALQAIKEKFARSAQNEANPLCQLVRDEQEYQRRRAQNREELGRWNIALQEVEAAREGGLPF